MPCRPSDPDLISAPPPPPHLLPEVCCSRCCLRPLLHLCFAFCLGRSRQSNSTLNRSFCSGINLMHTLNFSSFVSPFFASTLIKIFISLFVVHGCYHHHRIDGSGKPMNPYTGGTYSDRYLEILAKRKTLPVWDYKERFLQTLADNPRMVRYMTIHLPWSFRLILSLLKGPLNLLFVPGSCWRDREWEDDTDSAVGGRGGGATWS